MARNNRGRAGADGDGTMKTCSRCGIEQDESAFGVHSSSRAGLRAYCKKCGKAYNNSWGKRASPDFPGWSNRRTKDLFNRHGITPPEWERMWREQAGYCRCCSNLMTVMPSGAGSGPRNSDACVDHCHNLNYIRGLLCSGCNKLVGQLENMP